MNRRMAVCPSGLHALSTACLVKRHRNPGTGGVQVASFSRLQALPAGDSFYRCKTSLHSSQTTLFVSGNATGTFQVTSHTRDTPGTLAALLVGHPAPGSELALSALNGSIKTMCGTHRFNPALVILFQCLLMLNRQAGGRQPTTGLSTPYV